MVHKGKCVPGYSGQFKKGSQIFEVEHQQICLARLEQKKKLVRYLYPSLVHFHDIARLAAENQAQLFDGIGSNALVFPQRVKRARGKVVIPDKLVLGNILFL